MKPHFSIGDAAIEPLRMLTVRPLMLLVWGLIMLLPVIATLAVAMPIFAELAEAGLFDADATSSAAQDDAFAEQVAGMFELQLWSQLLNLAQLIGILFVTAAVIRAVFAGRRGDGTAFLRIGIGELQVAVVGVAIFAGVMILAIVATLLAVGIGFAFSSVIQPWRTLIYVVMGIGLILGFLLLWGRLSLIAPASLHYKTFAFAEGWRLGRGQTWPLFGLLLLLFVIAMVMGLLLILVFALVAGLALGGMSAFSSPEAMEAWFTALPEQPPAVLIGVGALALLPMAYLQGFSQALMTAPYAFAVRSLAAADASAHPAAIEGQRP